jgi:hypothetical protein
MTARKPRKLRPEEIELWFETETTKQFFEHFKIDYDRLMQSRINGSFYHPGEPAKTQEGFSFTAGQEYVLQQLLDLGHVKDRLGEGFGEEDDE